MTCYTGADPEKFEASVEKLKDAFANLLPEIFDKGNQQQFTELKENFLRLSLRTKRL